MSNTIHGAFRLRFFYLRMMLPSDYLNVHHHPRHSLAFLVPGANIVLFRLSRSAFLVSTNSMRRLRRFAE